MSWDIFFVDLPEGLKSITEVPPDFNGEPLGTRAELLAKIRSVAPETDFSDPAWPVLATEGFSIEFNIGSEDPVDSMMLHVRGNEIVLGVIRELASTLGRPPVDCSTGDLLDFDSPDAAEGFRKWRAFRDAALGVGPAPAKGPR